MAMTDGVQSERVLILDFGSQYTQLLARRVREAGVYSEIHAGDSDEQLIRDFQPTAIILSGGPESVTRLNGCRAPESIFTMDLPILGICYGMQIMAEQLGGAVTSAAREFGHAQLRVHGHSALLQDIQDETNTDGHGLLNVWMSHGDRVEKLPRGFKVIASTADTPIAGMADEKNRLYGLQFHPEVTHTPQGQAILRRFLHTISGCRSLWSMKNFIADVQARIKQQVGKDKVLLALSGGLDSSVAAALLHRAIGDQLTCILVDNGLLRLNEADQAMNTFAQHIGINVIRVDAEQRFLERLTGVTDPEQKRKIIGREFIQVFEEHADDLAGIKWLAQGTIYPDVIESAGAGSDKTQVIKSHHNVGGLPERMKMKLIEPLRQLFKDEVRGLGLQLGLPESVLYRHPFPGPGLAVRVLGEVKKQYVQLLRRADNVFIEELKAHNLYREVSQAFAVFLPVRSVGVMGDGRKYDHVISLRAVVTVDFMTAHWARLPHEFLAKVSGRIINEVAGVSRVTYDVSDKPPATIEWE